MQLPDAIDRIRPSIVQIRAVGAGSAPAGGTIGTGFVVTNAGHIITALHVVQIVLEPGSAYSLRVAFAGPAVDASPVRVPASFIGVPASILDTSAEDDLALVAPPSLSGSNLQIKVVGQPFSTTPEPVLLNLGPLRTGVDLAVSGYPLNEPSLVTNAGILASTFTVSTTGGMVRERYLGDFTANPGNSGGPVYTVHDATVIGACVATRTTQIIGGIGATSAGLTGIVPAGQIKAFLEKNSLELAQRRQAQPPAARASRRKKKR